VNSTPPESGPRRPGFAGALAPVARVLSRYEGLFLLVVAPLLLFPSPARLWALLVVPLLWLARWIATGRPLEPSPLNLPMLVLLLMVLVSVWATYDISVSLAAIARFVLAVAVLYAVIHRAQTERAWLYAVGLFVILGAGIAGLGLLGTQWIDKFKLFAPVLARLPSPAILPVGGEGVFHPNVIAGTLLWSLPLFIALGLSFIFAWRPIRAYIGSRRAGLMAAVLFLMSSFAVLVFLLTQSRGGYLSLGLTLLLMIFLWLGRLMPERPRLMYVALVAILAIGIGVGSSLFRQDTLALRELQNQNLADAEGFSLDTMEGRLELWSRAIYGIQDFSFTGMGMDTFHEVVHILYPLFTMPPSSEVFHSHNTYLQAGLDLGIPGLIAFLSLQIGALAMLVQCWRNRASLPFPPALTAALILGLAGGFIAGMLHGLVDSIILSAKPGFLWWYLLALIASLYRLTETAAIGIPDPHGPSAQAIHQAPVPAADA